MLKGKIARFVGFIIMFNKLYMYDLGTFNY